MKNSLTDSGKVLKLFISRKGDAQRSPQDNIAVDESGVEGDKFYAKDPQRSILLTSIDSYKMAEKENIIIEHGSLGENILIEYNPYHLQPGTTLMIGTVVLEINQNCSLCKSLTKIDSKLPKLLKNDRGIFVKVLKAGIIYTGDAVRVDV
ncbi:MAG: MOSC domain-containing protein [Campylobacterota bacterium]|nr:MOSC domain-containing protein [Campylobacterota bacterium]